MKFRDISHFACLHPSLCSIVLFSLYQLPYIIPISFTIASLMGSLLLFQNMSRNQELIALRASGISISCLLFPILTAGFMVSAITFTVIAGVAPRCKFLMKDLYCKTWLMNPFYLIDKMADGRVTGAYVDLERDRSTGDIGNLIMVLKKGRERPLELITTQKLRLEGDFIKGNKVALISYQESKEGDGFEPLVIENHDTVSIEKTSLPEIRRGGVNNDVKSKYLPFRELISSLIHASNKKPLFIELNRRLSLGMAPFFFTLVGAAFGISSHSRKKGQSQNVVWVISLVVLYVISFFGASSLKKGLALHSLLYFFPFPIAFWASILRLKRIRKGAA